MYCKKCEMLIHEGDLKWIKVYEHKLFNISGGKEGEEAVHAVSGRHCEQENKHKKKYEFLQN